MKIIRITFFILFTTLIYSARVKAQLNLFNASDLSTVNIDDYSDNLINSTLQKATDLGISQTQLLKLLGDKGLPPSEINKLGNRLRFISNSRSLGKSNITENSDEDTIIRHTYDTSASKIPIQEFRNDESIFGSELFTSNSLVFEPNLHIPAPAGYILGPDDEIIISVYGYSEKKYNLQSK